MATATYTLLTRALGKGKKGGKGHAEFGIAASGAIVAENAPISASPPKAKKGSIAALKGGKQGGARKRSRKLCQKQVQGQRDRKVGKGL